MGNAMLNELLRDFDHRPDTTLEWDSVAMARGETGEGGIQVPRFVVARPAHGGLNITVINNGESDPSMGDSFNLDPQKSSGGKLVLYGSLATCAWRDEILHNARLSMLDAVAVEPLAIDQKVATLLIPSIVAPLSSR